MSQVSWSIIALLLSSILAFAQTNNAPGRPGNDSHWPTAAKVGFGTANTLRSKVWFTLADGVMTEAFYPRLDVPNTQCFQFIVCTQGRCETEADDMIHQVRILNSQSLSFQQVNKSKSGAYTITKSYTTDPARPTILIQVNVVGITGAERLYLYFDPSLNNSGMHDRGWSSNDTLFAADKDVATAVMSDGRLTEMTTGYLGTSDGLLQLRTKGSIVDKYTRATDGNIVQVARISRASSFTVAIGFGSSSGQAAINARVSLAKSFARVRKEYDAGWLTYLRSINPGPAAYDRQYKIAAMVLKGLEDKTYRGAWIASPSIPWGGGPNANEPTISGYHAVWARDLYHVATAFIALGDTAAADRALNYLFQVQQKPNGSFPQNSWVDGRPIGGGLQMDQVAFPIVLAHQLNRTDRYTWRKHIKPAADFIVQNGPATGQDRWEEKPGYSPATIAAEIGGLVCAARIGEINGDHQAASAYLKVADNWEANIEHWTVTSNGPLDGRPYYLRITENGEPNQAAKIEINSGGGTYDQREIVDAGFLELVRFGVKVQHDPLILNSIAVVDRLIAQTIPAGQAWYRYNHDAYGETPDGKPYDGRTGIGRLWTLLAGERGEYELARGNQAGASKLLDTMSRFANEGLMFPEQVWDGKGPSSAGTGTRSATPLAWSMAQFIRLAQNLQAGRNLETPNVVASRYSR